MPKKSSSASAQQSRPSLSPSPSPSPSSPHTSSKPKSASLSPNSKSAALKSAAMLKGQRRIDALFRPKAPKAPRVPNAVAASATPSRTPTAPNATKAPNAKKRSPIPDNTLLSPGSPSGVFGWGTPRIPRAASTPLNTADRETRKRAFIERIQNSDTMSSRLPLFHWTPPEKRSAMKSMSPPASSSKRPRRL